MMTVSSNLYNLRRLSIEDEDITLVWRNSPRVRHAMFNTDLIDTGTHYRWIRKAIKNELYDYSIYECGSKPVGIVGIILDQKVGASAEWSFHIGEETAPKGSGYIMLSLALKRFFMNLNGRKICAEVLAKNKRSLSLHDRLGFKREGLRHAHVFHQDELEDVVEFGLLREYWQDENFPID